jgi:hypothetical protein
MRFAASAILTVLVVATPGCTRGQLIDIAMNGGPHVTPHQALRVGDRIVLAGDMHCHVAPPDASYHVSRELPFTLALASDESLDFVVLTPHVPRRFFMDDEMRGWVMETQQQLRARIEVLRPGLVVIPGFEYTDHDYGHVGAAFADPTEVLAGLSSDDARASPERFFEMWVARGGILTINHPVNRPLPGTPFRELAADISWRGFGGLPVPAEIGWITEHAQTIETFNSTVTGLRDQFVVGEEDRSLREAAHLSDRVARTQHRRLAAVGGSDSHGRWLRATTFVLAKERSAEGIREALATARTCVRGPEACTLEVRLAGGDRAWLGVGDSITADTTDAKIAFEARASGGEVTFVVNGSVVATAGSDQAVPITVPSGRCSVVRAIVDRSWSSGIYVNCF